jgi:hypothetical protein
MGGTWSITTVVAQALGSFTVMGICFFQGGWQLGRVDILALFIAFVALLCAQIFDAPALGTTLTIVADSAGMFLIIRKAARVPGAEHALAWSISLAAGPPAIIAAIITGGGMLLLSPIYLILVDGLAVVAIRSQRWKRYDDLAVPPITDMTISASA